MRQYDDVTHRLRAVVVDEAQSEVLTINDVELLQDMAQ